MSFTNQMPWSGVAGAPDGIVMVQTANFMTLLNGSPVGVLAGQSGSASVPPDMVWDWTNKLLYICTQSSGIPANTMWTQLEFVGPFVGTDITAVSLTATGAIADQGTLLVEGGATFQSNVNVSGALSANGWIGSNTGLWTTGQLDATGGGTLGGVFTGNPIFNFPLTVEQPINLPNNVFIQSANTVGTYHRLIGTDSNNTTYIGNSGGGYVGFLNQALSAWLLYSDNAGNVTIPGNLNVSSGEYAGSLTAGYLGSTGNLQVNGSGAINGQLAVGGAFIPTVGIYNIGGINGFDLYNANGTSLLNFASGNFIQYNGNLNYYTTGNHYFNQTLFGNTIQAGYLHSTGNVQADNLLTGGGCNVGGGQVTCGGLNASGGQVVCGDLHTSTVHADNTISAQGEIAAAGPMSCTAIVTTSTTNYLWSFWTSSNAYLRATDTSSIWDYGPISYTSDARLKENIRPANVDCLSLMQKVELKEFNWREGGEFVPVGFTTQQLESVFPGVVNHEPPDRPPGGTFYESVNINVMLALLVGAVQQLQAIVMERD